MSLDEAFIRFNNLFENSDEETSELLKLSMTHISAKHLIEPYLINFGMGTDILEKFGSLGKSVIQLFSSHLAIKIDGVSSCGEASNKKNKINSNLRNSLIEIIQKSEYGLFGPGEAKNKFESTQLWISLAMQFIGVLSYKLGINKAFYLLESLPFFDSDSYLIGGKDSKTFLQEYLQKYRKLRPVYNLLEQSGLDHILEFRVTVIADGKSVIGVGKTRKLAEQKAAWLFINKYLPPSLINSLQANSQKIQKLKIKESDKDKKILTKIFQELPNRNIVDKLMIEFDIKQEFLSELSLALVHCSYGFKFKNNYGCNNEILSFLGSSALMWAVQDIIIREHLKLDENLRKEHHIPIILSSIINQKSIADGIEILECKDGLLLGEGQINNIVLAMKAEVVQALVGCFYLARCRSIFSGEDILKSKNNKLLSWVLDNIGKSFNKKLQELLPPKTRFQEQCQAVGIKVVYESPELVNKKISRVKARLFSHENTESFLVSLKAGEYQIETKRDIESRLASLLSKIFQIVNGIEKNADSTELVTLPGHIKTANFLFANCIASARRSLSAKTLEPLRRMVKMNFFGLAFLRDYNFSGFNNWLLILDSFLVNNSMDFLTDIVEFYLVAGREVSNSAKFENIAIESIKGLPEYLDSLDPLVFTLSIQTSDYFRRVNDAAKVLRLTGSVIRIISIRELEEEISIIFRNQNVDILVPNSTDSLSVIEITGLHLALIQFLLNNFRDIVSNETNFILSLDYQENDIILSLKIQENQFLPDFIFELLEKSIFWVFLREVLPIKEVKIIRNSFNIFIGSISKSKRDNLIRQAFLAFNFGVSFTTTISNEVIPSILHDLKNEILAYQSAANQAIKATSMHKRHLIASEAYKHLDKAKEYISLVSSILKATVSLEIKCFSVTSFFREYISELFASLPKNIVISMPNNIEEANIYTDVSYLRSMLINICQNAADAMANGGKLSIEWIFDKNILEIEIQDNGNGLTEEQLKNLNSGIPISSSKKHGSGIGLLTVMMMIRKIGGSIKFYKSSGEGTIVNIFVPSLVPESEKTLTIEDTCSVSFDDDKDTIEL